MKKVPQILVDLGRAVEVIGDTWEWTWNKKDNWVLSSSADGEALYLFAKPKQAAESIPKAKTKNARALYKRFSRKDFEGALRGEVKDLIKKAGNAIHIVYESDKFGNLAEHIHHFDYSPDIWVDKPNKPSVMALISSKIRVTARGIEG